jgi:hypothetical protein
MIQAIDRRDGRLSTWYKTSKPKSSPSLSSSLNGHVHAKLVEKFPIGMRVLPLLPVESLTIFGQSGVKAAFP